MSSISLVSFVCTNMKRDIFGSRLWLKKIPKDQEILSSSRILFEIEKKRVEVYITYLYSMLTTDGSLSDTALSSSLLDNQLQDHSSSSWRRGGGGPSSSASFSSGLPRGGSQHYTKSEKSGLSKKSNSTSQLSATGQWCTLIQSAHISYDISST